MEPSNFVDPILKDAVVRAWGREVAPESLRARCQAAMASAANESQEPLRIDPTIAAGRTWRMWGTLAMAAMLLLAIGIGWFIIADRPADRPPAVLAGGIPLTVVQQVVQTHDRCVDRFLSNHHNVGCRKDDYATIKRTLEQRLGHPVWVTPVAGWEFRGAADCRTADGTQRCAHLLFARPDRKQTLSVISTPFEGSCSLRPSETFADQVERHPVVGFVEGHQLYCLVGSSEDGSLTVRELQETTESYRHNLHALHIASPDHPTAFTRFADYRK